jgi:signal transduction histidine kinase
MRQPESRHKRFLFATRDMAVDGRRRIIQGRSMIEMLGMGTINRLPPAPSACREKSPVGSLHLLLALRVGPLLAEVIAIYLFWAIPSFRPQIMILLVGIAIFWFVPQQREAPGEVGPGRFLAHINATFVTAYAASLLGGVQSPFFPWAAVALLLAILCLGRDPKRIAICCAGSALGLGLAHTLGAPAPPIPPRVAENLWALCISAALVYFLFAFLTTFMLKRKLSTIDRNEAIRFEQLAQAAESSDRQSTDFFSEANYAIRTPLNAIIGYSEMALEDNRDQFDEQQLGDVQRIHQACQQLLSILGDSFDLSEIEAAQTNPPLTHDPANP